MVKKLFKHECFFLGRILVPVFAIMLLLSVFLRLLQLFENDSVFYGIVFGFSVFAFVLALLACSFITQILSVIRFYKNLYSCEGYLSFALPVTNTQHLWIKILTPLMFQTIATLTIFLSVFISMGSELTSEIFKAIIYLLDSVKLPSIHPILYILEFIILALVSFCSQILIYYSCISIGQTRKKNRVGFAVVVYVIYIVIVQLITQAISIIFSIISMNTSILENLGSFILAHPISTVHILLCSMVVYSIIIAVVGYLINRHILLKKLNLE